MFIVYSKPDCTFCDQAKALLKAKGLAYEERILDIGQEKAEGKTYVTIQQLRSVVPNASSVPQILQDDTFVGGYTQLNKLLAA